MKFRIHVHDVVFCRGCGYLEWLLHPCRAEAVAFYTCQRKWEKLKSAEEKRKREEALRKQTSRLFTYFSSKSLSQSRWSANAEAVYAPGYSYENINIPDQCIRCFAYNDHILSFDVFLDLITKKDDFAIHYRTIGNLTILKQENKILRCDILFSKSNMRFKLFQTLSELDIFEYHRKLIEISNFPCIRGPYELFSEKVTRSFFVLCRAVFRVLSSSNREIGYYDCRSFGLSFSELTMPTQRKIRSQLLDDRGCNLIGLLNSIRKLLKCSMESIYGCIKNPTKTITCGNFISSN
ncbi:unnamed protein product [Lepeophtheirus salmonis]|uniref:(salmon louse) hypothetical protein n=1 Tax=Lepeophtheirus salmonis TaxID=72036 RepID=A0A7R8CZ63_LEPSM|nr:unnamed protein product [Lepeophtheirus salmonis]CAF2973910.1 unnamed protein product [Lepeophtheirus salmonis]